MDPEVREIRKRATEAKLALFRLIAILKEEAADDFEFDAKLVLDTLEILEKYKGKK